MPELPEVETVRRGLTKSVKNKIFKDVLILHKNIVEGDIKAIKNKKPKDNI